ncbi:MAG TPA: transporter substrate-binding domain-containing protein [Oceanithermus profundus]|uniref:Transporter substrate-binding domain-containing protein n=1 Tax=Oceanithermus profundus TaxID=187137 RepID=A0A7C4VDB2_9DEIN|nr:transporter substrate-binding domain-containing protein [Oceanithermus profundus]
MRYWMVVGALVLGLAFAAAPEKKQVTLAVGGKSLVVYLPLTVAEQLGYFADEGLDVRIEDFKGGSAALKALLGGSADLVVGYFDHIVRLQAQGRDLTGVVLMGKYPGLVLGVRSELADKVKTPADLKGLKVGVTKPGSSTNYFVFYLLAKEGLKPSDVAIIGVGGGASAIAAVERGQVDAISHVEPVITTLEKRGKIKVLVDTRNKEGAEAVFGGPYPAATLYTHRAFVEKNPETTQRLVNAIVRALQWMQGKSAEEVVAVMPKAYYQSDPELYTEIVRNSLGMFSENGLFPAEGPKTAYKVLTMFDEKLAAAQVDLAKTYTNAFVERALAK